MQSITVAIINPRKGKNLISIPDFQYSITRQGKETKAQKINPYLEKQVNSTLLIFAGLNFIYVA